MAHCYCKPSLSALSSELKKILIKNAFSPFDKYSHTLAQDHLTGGHELFKILVQPSLLIITIYI